MDTSNRSYQGFTQGQSVKDRRTGETVTLNAIRMRGDGAIMAHVAGALSYVAPLSRFVEAA